MKSRVSKHGNNPEFSNLFSGCHVWPRNGTAGRTRKHIPIVIGHPPQGAQPQLENLPVPLAAWSDSVSPHCEHPWSSRFAPKWGPHLWHRRNHHSQKTEQLFAEDRRHTCHKIEPMFYLSVRWVSGEELAFVRVLPDDTIGAVRHALVSAVGHGNVRLAYQDHLLKDSMQIGSLMLSSGSILYASLSDERGYGWRTTLTQPSMDRVIPEKWQLTRVHELPERESDENVFRARHGIGKRVLSTHRTGKTVLPPSQSGAQFGRGLPLSYGSL